MMIKEENFRKLYHKYIVIKADEFAHQVGQSIQLDIAAESNPDKDIEEVFKSIRIPENVNAILAIPYIDHEAGISFLSMAMAVLDGENVEIIKRESFGSLSLIRKNDIRDMEFEYLENLNANKDFDPEHYEECSRMLDTYSRDEAIEALRSITDIDHLRNEDYPDDILVHFIKEDLQAEGMWVRYESITPEGMIEGKLLNTPFQDFGVKAGDDVKVFPYKSEDMDELIIICDLNK